MGNPDRAGAARYETTTLTAYGRQVLGYVRAPANLKVVWAATAQYGDRDYLVFEDERISYRQAHAATRAIGAWLSHHGVTAGDRVAVAMRNYPEWMLIHWACVSIGVAVVGMNAWWTAEEMAFVLNDASPKVIFCDAERLERLAACGSLTVSPIIVAVRANPPPAGLQWSDVVAERGDAPSVDINPEDDASIFYTSGTTGFPKGAQLTHLSCVTGLMNQTFSADVQMLAAELTFGRSAIHHAPTVPVALATTPLFHATANNTLAQPVTMVGGTVVLMRKWDVETALRLIQTERVTHLTGVPLIVRELVGSAAAHEHDLSSLFALGGGGAAFPPDLIAKVDALDSPAFASTGFGMTEATGSMTVISREFFTDRPTSCGRLLPAYEFKLFEPQTDPSGRVVGEVCVKGASVIKGYFNRPDATAEAVVDGWFHTGDIGHLDEDGYLYIVDRKKDMVLRGGENVYCAEVEAALFRHEAIAEACVFGVEDARMGEEVGAAVMVRPEHTVTSKDLRELVATHLAGFKVPRFIWIFDTPLPRNASGKILRRELRATLRPEMAQ